MHVGICFILIFAYSTGMEPKIPIQLMRDDSIAIKVARALFQPANGWKYFALYLIVFLVEVLKIVTSMLYNNGLLQIFVL